MTIRSIVTATVLTVAFASPVVAQEGHAFERSVRTFDARASRPDVSAAAAYRHGVVRSNAPRRAYVSDNAGRAAGAEAIAPVQATRTINVWGARFEVPAY